MNEENDGRLSFDQAVHYVQQSRGAAFAAMPVFGDNDEAAEGARVFILEGDGAASFRLRFIAGPFFSAAVAADEIMAAEEIPDRIKELRFMPTRFEEVWLDGQLQILIQKLVQASGLAAPQMPDYASVPLPGAGPEAVFPITFVGRDPQGES